MKSNLRRWAWLLFPLAALAVASTGSRCEIESDDDDLFDKVIVDELSDSAAMLESADWRA